ncbi:conserved hypothetical protein [Leishmania infantum JPCM5]|uniref:Calponin_homology_(CH )_domain_containing_protein_-_putative n=2 Tax=Leishmania infantum TaxID=5671 RepID=A0A6L0XSW4_LEIIN|nr:conserved hypothetical protein [Leishmania infantum JPCM5]CAC9552229.1 Calponin_homology_(CH)_domain_containing_protein_-_putative [Leishmania infantum]CAM73003.1 conserved hypothetical protein [Leishmania infantum JPCM5]SUZ46895.1 Calponin_homology_(CH)_domain_containing_protein_-_putative [Leishmania infantum]|eukprot:XP_001469889.1 conserved hypothetical protein [Leishmania infantum JPCM5]
MSAEFTEQDKEDLREIFRIYDFSKVNKVDDSVALAQKAGQTPAELFDDLYQLFKIQKLPQRETVARRMREAVLNATDADIESVIRQSEMKGFTERDALRSLERKYSVQHLNRRVLLASRGSYSSPQCKVLEEDSELGHAAGSLHHIKVNETSMTSSTPPATSGDVTEKASDSSLMLARPPSKLSGAPTREDLDEIIAEEVREWVAKMVGDKYNADVCSMPNFVDALRSGVLLHVLLQKMESPPISDEDLKLPKRTTGFFVRDNVATFLTTAKRRYDLVDAQLFTVSDLVDGKNDRQVVTCLMTIARIAYSAGTIKDAPNIIVYEHEIEQQQNRLTRLDLDRIVQEAETDEGMPSLVARPDGPAEWPSSKVAPVPDTTSPTVRSCDECHGFVTPPTQESLGVCESAFTQHELAAPEVTVEGLVRCPAPDTAAVCDTDKVDDTRGEDTAAAASASPAGTHPPSTGAIECAAEPNVLSAPTDVREHSLPGSASVGQASPTRTPLAPAKSDEALAAVAQNIAVAQPTETTEETTAALGTDVSDAAPSGRRRSGEEDSDGGGRVFYLRDGMIHPAKPTPIEEKVVGEHRKKTGPRVVWKSTSTPLEATQPPRYHSRHWDGIDVALGRHLNAHYAKHRQSPWRFRTVTATSGEYVLYNRLDASRRVVFLRIIQKRLFLRNAGKYQRWIEIDEALEGLEKLEV